MRRKHVFAMHAAIRDVAEQGLLLVWARPHGVTQMNVGPTKVIKAGFLQPIIGVVGVAINLMLTETLPGGK